MDEQEEEPTSGDSGGEGDQQVRKRRRGLLRMYYGVDENGPLQEDNPLDIDKSGFRPQTFMEKTLKESSLNQLYRQEERMKKEIQELDTNMQYLVYENHSKFIKASETIREMKDDFQHLEDDMTHLSSRMEEIINSSNRINSALSERKKEISKLCGVHHLLKKLQFLFELPTRLNKCIEMGFHAQAVRTYCKAQRVLEAYQHMPSFHGIEKDCSAIVAQLKKLLHERMGDARSSTSTVAETVDLLLELGEPPQVLCQQFLEKSQQQLEKDLKTVTQEERLEQGAAVAEEPREIMDIQDYVSLVCSGFLANVSLVIQSCYDMFVKRSGTGKAKEKLATEEALQDLTSFVAKLMEGCLASVRERLKREAYHLESVQLVRALDRVSGKLMAMDQLLPSAELNMRGRELVCNVAEVHSECHYQRLQQSFSDALMTVRHSLATSKTSSSQPTPLSDHCSTLYATIKSGLEASLGKLKEFIEGNVAFSMKSDFRRDFCLKNVRNGVVIKFISYVLDTCKGFTECGVGESMSQFPPTLVLVLSRMVHDMERSTISYLVSYGDESFPPTEEGPVVATPMGDLIARAKNIAQTLLDHYVKVQGESISQMVRKSVETRDWLNTIEPRNVRSVMKRIVEEVTLIDKQVGSLYKEGARKEQGSEGQGSRHTYNYSLTQGKGYSYASHMDSSLLSNIQKLFYEKIEVFSTVEFSKLSITTGIVKIFLKAFLECVRLRTFGKFGLQQMQVDSHYLQIYLWRFVCDEQLVRVLLEQVVSSTMERCVEPMPMEQSIVEVICDKN